jgi:hypothetical protein
MLLLPRPGAALLVALALVTCALAATSTAQSTRPDDEQNAVVAPAPGTSLRSALAARNLTPADLELRRTTQSSGGRSP